MDFSAYANQYQYLDNVKSGTLSPRQPTQSDITGVKYRQSRLSNPMQQFLNDVQIREQTKAVAIWPGTAGGYSPRPPDQFTDAEGQDWIVLMADSDPVDSSVNCLLQRQQD